MDKSNVSGQRYVKQDGERGKNKRVGSHSLVKKPAFIII